ncbi:hypothetical protein OKW43_004880 [Paraburkholderia sp. WC7.3g]
MLGLTPNFSVGGHPYSHPHFVQPLIFPQYEKIGPACSLTPRFATTCRSLAQHLIYQTTRLGGDQGCAGQRPK